LQKLIRDYKDRSQSRGSSVQDDDAVATDRDHLTAAGYQILQAVWTAVQTVQRDVEDAAAQCAW
jgi:hypothetical protein